MRLARFSHRHLQSKAKTVGLKNLRLQRRIDIEQSCPARVRQSNIEPDNLFGRSGCHIKTTQIGKLYKIDYWEYV